jgi:hypothetical protein
MPGYGPHQVGAGFVSRAYVEAQFGAYGIADPRLSGLKVTNDGD